jgi:hypothetical protein
VTRPAFSEGDLVEITTPDGLAYVHVHQRPPSYPPILRILPGLHAGRPEEPARLLNDPDGTLAMVPLAEVLERLDLGWKIVESVPPSPDRPARFGMAVRDRGGRVLYWWFWDGETLNFSNDPAETERSVPLREITGADRFLEILTSRED